MGSVPETTNPALYDELRNRGLSKGEAARIANETPATKPRSKTRTPAKKTPARKVTKK